MQDDTRERGSLDTLRPSSSRGEVEVAPAASSSRAQAGPLPAKRGEIGYAEPAPPEPAHLPSSQDTTTVSPLPAAHPAERSTSLPASGGTTQPASTVTNDSASIHSARSSHSKLLKLLKPKRIPIVFGIRPTTLGLFLLHLAVLAGTIAGWALLANHLSAAQPSGNNSGIGIGSSTIFVHVAFGVACLAQLIFLERRIFRMRAERYCHRHPGLPTHTSREREMMRMGLAPWNRPPLPTYAAALAQSGVGTGDVEDSAIAVPPPPAYGHTRGSTLLLSGFMSNTLRAQRHQARDEGVLRASWTSGHSRPVSYVSRDEEWEERSDALRAVRLEETLAQLEEARVRE